ncbi:N-6 DNA methylase [Burkholderia gladioli pv. alliicola]|uniref:HsdM family class I SAM-dependent methyltransferase n=1 Tax=Burkholderia gladioli TaxID=28095 RepID=UPI0019073E54|nr:N-6 DNA methylase [Burkholderia gladioli]MBJ9714634.1 SAM-dependent DNA methyltransferase [Burkholderia gladioli]MDZ4038923.1 N-6 DNA methylase [Burkholderia gladioli pv. alliicola]
MPSFESLVYGALGLAEDSGHLAVHCGEDAHSDMYVVQNPNATPYMVCCITKSQQYDSDQILRKTLLTLPTVSTGLQLDSNGKIIKIVRKSFRTGDFDYIASIDVPSLLATAYRIEPHELKPLTAKLENVLFEIHSAFRDIDGLHAPDALDEICKLIYAKLYDEENSLKTGRLAFQRSSYVSVEECAAEIRRLYTTAIDDDKAIFVNKIPAYERSRGVFRDQLLLSSPAIVRAVEILQHYDIGSSPVDIKGRAFQNVLLPAVRSGMGQYFTPKEVIDFVVSIMRPNVRELIIDPFCGSGHFLTSAIDYVRTDHAKADKLFHEFAFTRLHGIEKSDRMVRVAMTDMRLHGDGHSNIRCIDSLLPFTNYPDLYRETFDVVMTNPPFGVDLPVDTLSQLGPFALASEVRSSISLEIVALERCLQLLRPGGRLAIVLPDSVLSNRNTGNVRDWVRRQARIRAIFSLPNTTFSPFGANIKTSILVLRKFSPGESETNDYNVFLADVESIGYDAAGRLVGTNDLGDVAVSFGKFIDKGGW